MSNIGMVESKLPPGFRFHPKDDELVCDYLMRKAATAVHPADDSVLMIEVDLNKCEPWDIPEIACVGGKEWYFYSQRDRKYATGLRTNRATASGYWKATGKDRTILRKGVVIGMRKTLVFYQGRAPKGRKTDWVMHEFRIEGPHGPPKISPHKEDWVLCRVFFKNREVVASRPSYFGLRDRGADSSLPPLMDSYSITFDPTQQHGSTEFDDEQVPCFSNIFSQPSSTVFPHCGFLNTKISGTDLDAVAAASYGASSSDLVSCFHSISYINNPSRSEKKVLKDVLNQLTGNSNRDGAAKEKEGSTDSCFSLSHGGSVWGNY